MCERNGDFMLLTMMIGLISTYLPLDRVSFLDFSLLYGRCCAVCAQRIRVETGQASLAAGISLWVVIATINFCMAGRRRLIFMYLRSIAPPLAAQR